MSKSYKIWGGYNTEEKLTGETWIDGKPIYRKILVETPGALGEGGKWVQIKFNHGISNFDSIVNARGFIKQAPSANYWYILPFSGASGGNQTFISYVESSQVILETNDNWGADRIWYIILEYTKK